MLLRESPFFTNSCDASFWKFASRTDLEIAKQGLQTHELPGFLFVIISYGGDLDAKGSAARPRLCVLHKTSTGTLRCFAGRDIRGAVQIGATRQPPKL